MKSILLFADCRTAPGSGSVRMPGSLPVPVPPHCLLPMEPQAPWYIPISHEYSVHEDGSCFAFDSATGETWEITPAVIPLLEAIRGGWQPGQPVGEPLQEHLGTDPADLEELEEVLEGLREVGLVGRGELVRNYAATLFEPLRRHGWSDIRLRMAFVPPVPAPLRAGVLRAAYVAPFLALLAFAFSGWFLLGGGSRNASAGWVHFLATGSAGEIVGLHVAVILLLTGVHELGHALVAAAATGRRIPIGLRLNFGIPQGYSDVHASIGLARRQDRVAVILGGLALEILVWAAFLPLALRPEVSPLVFGVVLLGGGISVLINLVPFWKNDGYLLLSEVSRIRDLMERALAGAGRTFFGEDGGSHEPAWVVWLGLLQAHGLSAAVMMGGILVGRLVGLEALGGILGLAIALFLLTQRYRAMIRYSRQGGHAS